MDGRSQATESDRGTEPFSSRQLRILKIAVVVMGIVLAAGFAAVIGRIVYLVAKGGSTPASSAAPRLAKDARLMLPAGASVRSMSFAGDRLAVHYDSPAGAGIAILDLLTGEALTHVEVVPK